MLRYLPNAWPIIPPAIFFVIFPLFPVQAGLVATLDVSVSRDGSSGLYTYVYVLRNNEASDHQVIDLILTIPHAGSFMPSTMPEHWEVECEPTIGFILWNVSRDYQDKLLVPGGSVSFSLQSRMTPELGNFEIDGLSLESGLVDKLKVGKIIVP